MTARRVSTASGSERVSRHHLLVEATLATARGTDSLLPALLSEPHLNHQWPFPDAIAVTMTWRCNRQSCWRPLT